VVVKLGSIDQGERVEVPAGIDQLADVQPAAGFGTPIYSPVVVLKLGSIDQGERVEVPAGIDQLADVQRAVVLTAPIYSRPWC